MRYLKAGILLIAAAALAAFVIVAPAGAQQPSFTGCHLTAAAGGSMANVELSVPNAGSIDGLGAQGLAGRLGAGCDVHWLATGLLVGIGADYTWQNPELSLTVGPQTFEATLEDSWTAYGRVGMVNGNALAYVLAGYTETKWSTNAPGLPTPDLTGWTAGGGVALKLDDAWSIGGEYRFTRYETETIKPVDLDADQHTFMVRLNYELGSAFSR